MPTSNNEASAGPVVTTSFADALRELADLVDAHEILRDRFNDFTLNLPCADAEAMARLVRAIGGKWDKTTVGDDYVVLRRAISPDVRIDVYARHENVCERVVTGTRTVKQYAPTVDVEEDVVEWVCPPSLLAMTKGEATG